MFKSRNLATKFVSSNRLRVSGQLTQKPHKLISVGDILTLQINEKIKIFKVVDIPNRRGPYSEALLFYKDLSPKEENNKLIKTKTTLKFVQRVGRPTKLERRQTDKLMGRD
jgi:ribosome-associated heat shock protein Hsp15